ncbi:DoxX family protein [Streptomyces sp. NPDC002886]|uniref:DoxX family protein n=1 Tax=Streptomyces sp. NPDC002886 TaxID=3364667 RepID=UPI0036ACCBA1
MNIALWIVTVLLAVAYLLGGAFKVFTPKEKIAASGASAKWVEDFIPGSVKAIGAVEMLAATALILPAALNTAPVLVPLAALGLVLLMLGATLTRYRRHEPTYMAVDLAYVLLATFVTWGRFALEPFTG